MKTKFPRIWLMLQYLAIHQGVAEDHVEPWAANQFVKLTEAGWTEQEIEGAERELSHLSDELVQDVAQDKIGAAKALRITNQLLTDVKAST